MDWGSIIGAGATLASSLFGGGDTKTTTQNVTASAMPRPEEFGWMFDEFLKNYLGSGLNTGSATEYFEGRLGNLISKIEDGTASKEDEKEMKLINQWIPQMKQGSMPQGALDMLDSHMEFPDRVRQISQIKSDLGTIAEAPYLKALRTAYAEEAVPRQAYIGAVGDAAGTHSGLLSDIITKQMGGEDVGPYSRNIQDLLGERTSISFGGSPMNFITGSQQRLLGDLMGSQRGALQDIAGMSGQRMQTDILPSQAGMELFQPSNQAELSFLQDLWSKLQPMETTRFGAQPSISGTTEEGSTIADLIANIGSAWNLGGEITR